MVNSDGERELLDRYRIKTSVEGQGTLWLVVAIGVVLVLVLRLQAAQRAATDARERADREIRQFQVEAQDKTQQVVAPLLKQIEELSGRVEDRARAQFDEWRQNESEAIRRREIDSARREARVLLDAWKVDAEAGIRTDAIQRSQAVITGKVSEHIAPYLPQFKYNPRDARFLGTPVDFVVFDGLEQHDVRQVVFIEVKAGSGSLSPRERHIRDAVSQGRVVWEQLRIEVTPASPNPDVIQANSSVKQNAGAGDAPGSDVKLRDQEPLSSKLWREHGAIDVTMPGTPSKTIRAICSGCGQIESFTVAPNERAAACGRCGVVQTLNINWNAQ